MTREEAILCLKGMKNYARDTFTEQTDWQTSLDMAIEALEQEPFNVDTYCEEHFMVMVDKDVWEKAEKPLKQEPKTEWIPIEWRPFGKNGYPKPEDEYKHFLTIDNKGEITIQEFLLSLDEEPQPYFTGMRKVIAWMPLPKPYKAEGEGK